MIGTKLAHYEITSHLGTGGMGEVYQATDSKLGRSVAIKLLPEAFSHDNDRAARFEREARVLASLNHPNIAAIYGVEESGGRKFLVMELVPGETLAERIKRGPIAADEALGIAKEITEGLEAAHEKGVIHRDLKPANVKITADGKVKILDFGLAKAMENVPANTTMSNSPTLSLPGTMQGMILGTAAYMSPEQAKGFNADQRSDIFSFGCVLYEGLTGKPAFDGDTVSEILASVLKAEPDWTLLPNDLNPKLRGLLRRCLEKNPRRRWYAIGDVRVELEAVRSNPAGATLQDQTTVLTRPLWKRATSIMVAMAVGFLIAGVVFWSSRSSIPLTVTKFSLSGGDSQAFTTLNRSMLAISPDGTQMVYVANRQLYLRSMSELEARPILGTDDLVAVSNPVFSPNGRSIAFWSGSDQALKTIAVGGGAPVTIYKGNLDPFGVSWSSDGIVFNQSDRGHEIMRVSANGDKPELLVNVNVEEGTNTPQVLPGGQSVLFTVFGKNQIVVQSLKSGARKILIEDGASGRYLPTGHLVYALGGNLWAVPFDLQKLDVTGGAIPIVEGVRRMGPGNTGAQFSFSDNGSLVYVTGPTTPADAELSLALIDWSGAVKKLEVRPKNYRFPRISRDGKRLAFETDKGKEAIIWIYDLAGTSEPRPLTIGGANRYPIWSPDGERIAFQSDREGDFGIWWQRADGTGTAQRFTKPQQGVSHIPDSWSPDGQMLSFTAVKGNESAVWIYSLKDEKERPFAQVPSKFLGRSVFSPGTSPGGQWLAYQSNEATTSHIIVEPFPATGSRHQVSTDGNNYHPLWSPDGKELFYFDGQGRLRGGSIGTEPGFHIYNPVSLPMPGRTGGPANVRNHDMLNGKQFIGVVDSYTAPPPSSAAQINVVLNWFEELKQRFKPN